MKPDYEVVAQVSDLAQMSGNKAIVVGDVVLYSLQDDAKPPASMSRQEDRLIYSDQIDRLLKTPGKMRLYVDTAVMLAKGKRFAFAMDGYLAWGRRNKGKKPVILFGGASSDLGLHVDVLVFERGLLTLYKERMLPPIDSATFIPSLQSMLEEIRALYPESKMHQAEPLEAWGDIAPEVKWVGRDALRGIRYERLATQAIMTNPFVVPGAMVAAGLMVYGGVVGFQWNALQKEVAAYEVANSNSDLQKQGGLDAGFLDLMNARRLFMETPRDQERYAERAIAIAAGLSRVQGLKVVELKVPANPTSKAKAEGATGSNSPRPPRLGESRGRAPVESNQQASGDAQASPDVEMTVSALKSTDSAIDQAEIVMRSISDATGLSLRLSVNGPREVEGRRVFLLEGFTR